MRTFAAMGWTSCDVGSAARREAPQEVADRHGCQEFGVILTGSSVGPRIEREKRGVAIVHEQAAGPDLVEWLCQRDGRGDDQPHVVSKLNQQLRNEHRLAPGGLGKAPAHEVVEADAAKDPADVAALRERQIEQFAGKLEDAELDVPWTAHRVVHAIHERATVLAEHHHDAGTRLTIRAPSRVVAELRAALQSAS
ncbi:MAG TPA: hypothetical protein VF516_01235 [Kofleriaceae bacterium]